MTIPAPAHLSPEAAAVLRIPPQPSAFPPPDDLAAWEHIVEQGNNGMTAHFVHLRLPMATTLTRIDDVPVWVTHDDSIQPDSGGSVILDVHGGALILGGGDLTGLIAKRSAHATGRTHWGVDYRMPPLHPYPTPVDDVYTVLRHLLTTRDSTTVAVIGGSAGGNLAVSALIRARDAGLPRPAALVLEAPEVDLTESGDTFATLTEASNLLGSLEPVNRLYAAGRPLADPAVSPLFADLRGLPPTLLWTGTRDLFLSNTVRMHRALLRAGVPAELHVWDGMPHGGFPDAPEGRDVDETVRGFLTRHGL